MNTHPLPNGSPDPLQLVRLPMRLNAGQAARLLGFAEHDIPQLVAAKLLQPLGKPPLNGSKFFATFVIEELRTNHQWLNAATRTMTNHWKHRNTRLIKRQQPPTEVTT